MTPAERNKRIEEAQAAAGHAEELLGKIAVKTAQLSRDVKKLKSDLTERLAEQDDKQQEP